MSFAPNATLLWGDRNSEPGRPSPLARLPRPSDNSACVTARSYRKLASGLVMAPTQDDPISAIGSQYAVIHDAGFPATVCKTSRESRVI